MSFLKGPKAPAPDPKLLEAQERQEERLAAQEAMKMKQIAAKQKVMSQGGYKSLLSEFRPEPEKGITKTTLGVS